ncbi:MAG: imidazole glycerol phosphate synthase subunit HisH [Eubacterium coprostanoligenes]|uniref:imidazole glycerol phosphate synthase subunit HisH n=1 Tax=Eubacterium coprostanoligenes TaxID=290054 RepID=UPI0023F0E401|nr:imidazole glycerol phosphate synthase subunit HisH [Eubacterium coprostanoligenes]MDD7357822.1 imidazole glycerol phosphate synthase subunit HisH [Eubacterium coprostanoligenes]
MVAIIDYGAGNLQSVKKALDFIGTESKITDNKDEINAASHIILPGVGSFADAMSCIRERGLEETIKKSADGSKHFLGICLGLQLLFESSEESPGVKGLGVFKGDIVTIPKDNGLKVPHIGWNSVKLNQTNGIFEGIKDESYFYFVHSYYLKNADEDIVAGTTEYGVSIQCAVQNGRVCATQFHPEKSSEVGLALLKNFVNRED